MILNGLCVKNQTKKIYLITGAAGFIGSSLCLKLANNNKVIGIDNLTISGEGIIYIDNTAVTIKSSFALFENCNNIIIELQHKEYNLGAALKDEVIEYLNSIGFRLMAAIRIGEVDGDYHFIRP